MPLPLGILSVAGASGGEYWLGLLRSNSNEYSYALGLDSSNNVYVSGGGNGFQLAKYNNLGVLQWQRLLANSSTVDDMTVEPSGTSYVIGRPNSEFNIAKYNSAGAIQWQRRISISGHGFNTAYIVYNTAGYFYINGWRGGAGGGEYGCVVKCDTNGGILWQRFVNTGTGDSGSGIGTDSSGNAYFLGASNQTATNLLVAKYNTSGTIQWQRRLTPGNVGGVSGVADSSGNFYTLATGAPSYFGRLQKFNTSGTLLWQRRMVNGNVLGYNVAVDSSGFVYVTGTTGSNLLLLKYNGNGVLQWQRQLRSSSGLTYGDGLAVDSLGNIYVSGYSNVSGNYDFIVAKLPGDGSKTGTYSVGSYSFTYEVSDYAEQADTLQDQAGTANDLSHTFSSNTTSHTDSAGTLTSSVVNF